MAAQRLEEEKKLEEQKKAKGFGAKLKKFFKDDIPDLVKGAATAIAGPPAAFLGQATDVTTEVVEGGTSSSEEEREVRRAVRNDQRRREAERSV